VTLAQAEVLEKPGRARAKLSVPDSGNPSGAIPSLAAEVRSFRAH
jgi:hypothetical protein